MVSNKTAFLTSLFPIRHPPSLALRQETKASYVYANSSSKLDPIHETRNITKSVIANARKRDQWASVFWSQRAQKSRGH